jgi:hypothetical protein
MRDNLTLPEPQQPMPRDANTEKRRGVTMGERSNVIQGYPRVDYQEDGLARFQSYGKDIRLFRFRYKRVVEGEIISRNKEELISLMQKALANILVYGLHI